MSIGRVIVAPTPIATLPMAQLPRAGTVVIGGLANRQTQPFPDRPSPAVTHPGYSSSCFNTFKFAATSRGPEEPCGSSGRESAADHHGLALLLASVAAGPTDQLDAHSRVVMFGGRRHVERDR